MQVTRSARGTPLRLPTAAGLSWPGLALLMWWILRVSCRKSAALSWFTLSDEAQDLSGRSGVASRCTEAGDIGGRLRPPGWEAHFPQHRVRPGRQQPVHHLRGV